jgi:hypothetical protein
MQYNLRIQHIIVLTALFVSLFGSLLVLDKMNESATPITGATTTLHGNQPTLTEETTVRVVKITEKSTQNPTSDP